MARDVHVPTDLALHSLDVHGGAMDRLHAWEVDYREVADYYKGNPDGGYRSFVYTDAPSADELVRLLDFVERDVRARLDIPFNPGAPALRYEHSMGQLGRLPRRVLRTTRDSSAARV